METILAIADTLQQFILIGRNPGRIVLANAIGDGALNNIPPRRAFCVELAMAFR
jgi:hypothetical protein